MYGYEPRPLPSVISETHIPAAESCIKELSEARNEALAAHDITHRVMKDQSMVKFSPFLKGDKVWLEARNLKCLYENCKLAPKREGPFLISEVLSPITYRLAIPTKWKILSRPCPTPDSYPVTPDSSQHCNSTPVLCASLRSRTCTYPSAKCDPLH